MSKLDIFDIDELIALLLDIKDIETFQFLTKMLSISSIVALSIQLLLEAEVGLSIELLTESL